MKAHNLSMLVGLFSLMISANAQEKKLEYNIKRNGDVVGNIHFIQGIAGSRTVLTMESEVNTRFIFNFKAKAKEEAIYDNGIMTWSSIFRKLNGNIKVDKKTLTSEAHLLRMFCLLSWFDRELFSVIIQSLNFGLSILWNRQTKSCANLPFLKT